MATFEMLKASKNAEKLDDNAKNARKLIDGGISRKCKNARKLIDEGISRKCYNEKNK